MNELDRKAWRADTGIFLVFFVGLLALGPSKMLRDPGTFWHTVVGEKILRSASMIRTDPFSFTCEDQPWIAQQWLGECGMALMHRLAGLDGLVLAAAALLAALFAWLGRRLMRSGLPWPAAALLLMLVVAASSYHFIPRPHLATILMMAWCVALLHDVEAGRIRSGKLLLLPPAFLFWTNIHGGVLGGIATTMIVMMAWLLRPANLKRVPADPRPTARPLLIAVTLSLSFVAVLVNPYGPALPRVWLSLMNADLLPKLIIEHAPLQLLSPEGLMILTLAAVYLGLLASVRHTGIRATWLLPLIWLALALSRVRHGPLFAVTAAIAIADMLPFSPLAKRFMQPPIGQRAEPRPPGRTNFRPAIIPLAAVLLVTAIQTLGIPCPIIGADRCRPDPRYWPVIATEVLHDHLAAHPDERRIFNDMLFGGYLIYHVPQAKVYIDDRCELYREPGLERYVDIRKHPERMAGLAVYDDIDLALVAGRSPLVAYFDRAAAWTELHRDSTAALYRRIR